MDVGINQLLFQMLSFATHKRIWHKIVKNYKTISTVHNRVCKKTNLTMDWKDYLYSRTFRMSCF